VSERRDDSHGEGHDPQEEVGSLADEAVRLFGALSDWARDATEGVEEHVATGGAECTWCPLCRTAHAVREAAGPEVRSHLAVAASALLQAAAGVLAAAAPAPGSPGQGDMGFEHIDLDGDPDGEHDGAWPEEDDE
jgi:hypothetical protein